MCGIFGSPTFTPSVRKMLPYLGIEMEDRGHDAWGCSNGNAILRHVGPLTESWHEDEETIMGWTQGIFHTRGASCGSAKVLENAHPFAYQREDKTWVIGIHNGIISNHDELDNKYGRKCDVDSMHLWMHRAEGKPWSDLHGWGNLAWWEHHDRKGKQVLNLARFNNAALHLAQLEQGEYVFASTIEPIRTIARMVGNPVKRVMDIKEYHHYWFEIERNGLASLWKRDTPLPFSHTTYSAGTRTRHSGSNSTSYVGAGAWSSVVFDGFCNKCTQSRIKSKEQILCSGCMAMMVTDFLEEEKKAKAAS